MCRGAAGHTCSTDSSWGRPHLYTSAGDGPTIARGAYELVLLVVAGCSRSVGRLDSNTQTAYPVLADRRHRAVDDRESWTVGIAMKSLPVGTAMPSGRLGAVGTASLEWGCWRVGKPDAGGESGAHPCRDRRPQAGHADLSARSRGERLHRFGGYPGAASKNSAGGKFCCHHASRLL